MRETQRTDHTALRTVELAELDALEVGGGGAVECWRAGAATERRGRRGRGEGEANGRVCGEGGWALSEVSVGELKAIVKDGGR